MKSSEKIYEDIFIRGRVVLMRKCLIKPALVVLLFFSVISAFSGNSAVYVNALDSVPESVVVNFGTAADSSFNFTWDTSENAEAGAVEYCPKSDFCGFGKPNILRANARSYITKNNKGTRRIHKAELNSLKPGTAYIYRVGSSASGYSRQGELTTSESNPYSFTFINITDTQGENSKDYSKWKNTLDSALKKFPEARFLVHTGDMVDNGDSIYQWDLFSQAVKSELMKLPIVPAVGNHEAFNKNLSNPDFKNFTDKFNIIGSQNTGAPYGTVYSFNYGNVHFSVMNTQYGSNSLKKQAEWLKADLSKNKKPWKVVVLHRGPYGATYDTTDIRRLWTPVFDEFGVDLVLQGHDHNYVRSYPMKGGKRAEAGKGTVYMDSNTGGVKFYPLKQRSWQAVVLQPKTRMYIAVTVQDKKMVIKAYDAENILKDSYIITHK